MIRPKKKISERSNGAPPSEEAIALFLRMSSDEATPEDVDTLIQWAEHQPEKLGEIEELSRFWEEIAEIPPVTADKKMDAGEGLRAPRTNIKKVASRRIMPIAAAAAALLLVFVSATGLWDSLQTGDTYATARAEVQDVVLADGSRLYLNGRSRITVNFDADTRHVTLAGGEAFFEVASDKERPFIVKVGNYEVRAVGTAFNIDFAEDFLDVAVVHGEVELESASSAAAIVAPVRVHAVERVIVEKRPIADGSVKEAQLTRRDIKNIDAVTAWRTGTIHLTGQSLILAAKKINRLSRRTIVIADSHIKDFPIYGSFHAQNLESFIAAVEDLYPVRAVRERERVVLYAARPELRTAVQ